ncbi:hypothetical protein [Nannocystis sp. SCPEA4]|uniref:hypothetical protein n=1 Tax=Nannocystis sp. SCPEA4 TaxID=2996787 RepID=UPI00226DDEBB|nr:hypothetical protein [Nannocystis sp. SCPEA4]MCY1060655.1 hypothetical protein [Nannocystis sp. SCPEA4]
MSLRTLPSQHVLTDSAGLAGLMLVGSAPHAFVGAVAWEWLGALVTATAVVAKRRKKWLAAVRQILGDRLSAEVFTLALDGLTVDTLLRKRIGALVERFAG